MLSGGIAMTLSIGIDFDRNDWKTCEIENGQTLELCSFVNSAEVLAYVERNYALYPELTIVVSAAGFEYPFTPLPSIRFLQLDEKNESKHTELQKLLIAIGSMNLNSYCAPSVKYLPTVSLHRKLVRPHLGAPDSLCAVAALLHGLREREAAWPEMQFLCVKAGYGAKSILVVEDGRIVNGIGGSTDLMTHTLLEETYSLPNEHGDKKLGELEQGNEAKERDYVQQASEQAFWEGLTQELAGLMAIHHLEDMVVMGESKEALIERFADSYQVYLFPNSEVVVEGYESALGAAVIAEGLYCPGLTSEVVERLQIREASAGALKSSR
jgi:predicted butyrate kinase (DUF1464 family)